MLVGWGGRTRTYAVLGSKPSALPTWRRPNNFGAPGRIRTPGTRIRSPLLYPTELQVHILERVKGIEPSRLAWKARALPLSYTRIIIVSLFI